MTPEEYVEALERERNDRNERAEYIVREEYGAHHLMRRNGAGQSWGVTRYVKPETAALAAALLNRLKEDEA
ncbi:hypothetical protein J7I94_19175 [Streptomyces sp. ISL-12]|uniref:hypothetical protein n=1 Tax=Streptomyces sp. ISL-12 TaxID=2819177 RepID=UPI001BEAF15A|nr:hypothetical protein [Streptomyces sp. ISL-12]MBT2412657.1 hypothetical protein [Streptomyces sp. ISL-12]